MHVAIVIVGFRNCADVADCLKTVERLLHTDCEVVVCENGGAAAASALREAIPDRLMGGQPVTIVEAVRNLGYAGGVNLGMASAPAADAWWVINPDTEPQPQALSACLDRLAIGDCDAVGATLYLPDGTVQAYAGIWHGWLARAVSLGYGRSLDAPVDATEVEARQSYLSGASMLIGRRFLAGVGPMREDYFLYCEEVEWFIRARKQGFRLGFAPAARILHHGGSTTGSYDPIKSRPRLPIYLNERNKLILTRDHFPLRLPVAAAAALALIIARYGRQRAWTQMKHALAGWFAGLRNERGAPQWATNVLTS